jgi:hypothetical protein
VAKLTATQSEKAGGPKRPDKNETKQTKVLNLTKGFTMKTENNFMKIKCSEKCWDCALKGTEKCLKNKVQLKPLKNPMKIYHTRWNRRLENSLAKRFILSFNQRLGQ